jgi:hypothetical protein
MDPIQDIAEHEGPPETAIQLAKDTCYFRILSMIDQIRFVELIQKNHQIMSSKRILKTNNAIEYALGNVSDFINYDSDSRSQRAFVAGFSVSKDFIAYNIKKLENSLQCKKTAINLFFSRNGYIVIPQSETGVIFPRIFKKKLPPQSELRWWTVRNFDQNTIDLSENSSPETDIGKNFVELTKFLLLKQDQEDLALQLDVIHKEAICPNCHIAMTKRYCDHSQTGFHWRCTKCSHTESSMFHSIFQNTKSSIDQLLLALFCFSRDFSYEESELETSLDRKTLEKIFSQLRLVIHYLDIESTSNHLIGGPNMSVQIDETYISKRKYNVGRLCCSYWVVGGICEETKEIFLMFTTKRTQKVLQEFITSNVYPGTHIKTDSWKGYNFLDRPPVGKNFTHSKVNHKIQFVSSDGTHTQEIERLWGEFKQMKKRRRGFKIERMEIYLSEFKWRYMNKIRQENPFKNVLDLCRIIANSN